MSTGVGIPLSTSVPIGPRLSEAIEESGRGAIEVITLFEDAILDVRHLVAHAANQPFTIGPDPRAEAHVPGSELPISCFPLVRPAIGGEGWELLFTAAMKGEVLLDGKEAPLGEAVTRHLAFPALGLAGAYAWPLSDGARARVVVGEASFLVRAVAAPRRYPVPLRLDGPALAWIGVAAAAFAVFLGVAFSLPPEPRSLSLDNTPAVSRLGTFVIKPPQEEQQNPKETVKLAGADRGGQKAPGPNGVMGNPKSRNHVGLFQIKGPAKNLDPRLAKQYAEQAARNTGVLSVLTGMAPGSPFASVFSKDDSALGDAANDVLGGLQGTQVGDAFGCPGCLGTVGRGPGGDGIGNGPTLGRGDLGRIGAGNGPGPGHAFRPRAPGDGPGTRPVGAPDTNAKCQVRGGLDKSIIRRVVRDHINEVRYCYEKELAKKPELYGRVSVQFTITGLGQVVASTVQNTTMNDPAVEHCIAESVRRWAFPRPDGGGLTVVSYPFMLQSSARTE